MVDYRRLKELIKLMTENDLSELELRDQQETVVIKRGGAAAQGVPYIAAAPATALRPAAATDAAPGVEDEEAGLRPIVSPMVGTFYSAPDPESPAFVSVGSNVSPETVVCIVEAMKVFSEIKAECSGRVEKVLVKSGEPVEYGQRLFLVRAA